MYFPSCVLASEFRHRHSVIYYEIRKQGLNICWGLSCATATPVVVEVTRNVEPVLLHQVVPAPCDRPVHQITRWKAISHTPSSATKIQRSVPEQFQSF